MINKSIRTKGVNCSKVESDDLFNADEPNSESYHDNTMKVQINLVKTELRQIVIKIIIIGNETADDIAAENEFENSAIRNKTTCFSYRRTHC